MSTDTERSDRKELYEARERAQMRIAIQTAIAAGICAAGPTGVQAPELIARRAGQLADAIMKDNPGARGSLV